MILVQKVNSGEYLIEKGKGCIFSNDFILQDQLKKLLALTQLCHYKHIHVLLKHLIHLHNTWMVLDSKKNNYYQF